MISQHQFIDWATQIVFVSSLTHSFLPPWELFEDFPRTQKVYRLFVYIVGYMALNGRSSVYQSLSTKNGQQPSRAVTRAVELEKEQK